MEKKENEKLGFDLLTSEFAAQNFRMKCLEAAIKATGNNSPLELAKEFYDWVKG